MVGKEQVQDTRVRSSVGKPSEDFRALWHRILHYASSGVSRVDFLREVTRLLLDFSGCHVVELCVKKEDKCFHCEATHHPTQPFTVEVKPCTYKEECGISARAQDKRGFETLCRAIIEQQCPGPAPLFTKHGSFWIGNTEHSEPRAAGTDTATGKGSGDGDGNNLSLVVIPLIAADEIIGLVKLKSEREGFFQEDGREFYEDVAQTVGLALVNQLAHSALCERVKELTCLYSVAQLVERPGVTLEEILQGIVELLPPAWQFPEITAGRIILDGRSYVTANLKQGVHRQSTEIVVSGERRGVIEVVYLEEKPELDEGPFLNEERSLIDALARQISLIIQRRQTDEEKMRLQDQLRHADRLATIGQLAAGVAHELNEPLGNILGFAQLAKKCEGLPECAESDIGKIETASLHAREVIKKLMIFARQMPPQKTQVNLNEVVEEGLYFLESRCAKDGIELLRALSQDLPEITADPAQLNQVLVNLVVNALQAMENGGTLTVRTLARKDHVSLVVEDTGIGMSEKVVEQIFIPFFTTKEVGRGTGLGLPVVHGIVTSHGGSIEVRSKVGRGARFKIQLPLAGPPDMVENGQNVDAT